MKAVSDFNYRVALASGLKELQAGKLRQAEEQFRYLVSKFPNADGGYRGLARVLLQLGDAPAALMWLREGAAALSRAGQRTAAIDLLRECTAHDPLDVASHRRLAAALALAGDVSEAAHEYVRSATAHLQAGDEERARIEATYALETLGEIPALHDLARTLGLPLRTVRRAAGAGDVASEASHLAPTLAPAGAPDGEGLPGSAPADDARWRESARPSSTSPAPAPAGAPSSTTAPAADPFVLEARAMALIDARDEEAGPAAIAATRVLMDVGKVQAASDLLLELVAAGIAVHDAERELIAVARELGRDDIAEERGRLLEEAAGLG